jgi:hypothetical protein
VSSREVGADLERRTADYLTSQGYRVTTNARIHGRSGVAHEVDVLAVKQDGVSTYTVAVECTEWQAPVGKDVVAKLAFVSNDINANKGILVAPGGLEPGASAVALALGIDVWTDVTASERVGFASGRSATNTFRKVLPALDRAYASSWLRRQRSGWLNKEEVTRLECFDVVCVDVEWFVTVRDGRREKTERIHHWHDTLTWEKLPELKGKPSWSDGEPDLPLQGNDVDEWAEYLKQTITLIQNIVSAKTDLSLFRGSRDLKRDLEISIRDAERVVRNAGFRPDAINVSVGATELFYYPHFVGRLSSGRSERYLVMDAISGRPHSSLAQLLTRNPSILDSAFRTATP